MTRFVVDSDVVLRIAAGEIDVHPAHQLVAPALVRSQVLATLSDAVRRGELDRKTAIRLLDRIAEIKMRLLADRSSRRRAFEIAERLGCVTAEAEYLAVAQLQADALVTLDEEFARRAQGEVELAPVGALATP